MNIYSGLHTYKYKAFGLKICSDIEMLELLEDNSWDTDLNIKFGKVPDTFENVIINTKSRLIGKNNFRLDNAGIAKYFVKSGNEIIVEPYKDAFFEEIKVYLLGSCMGALLYQREILPLHGSCINIGGKGILLTGISGAGKSTIGRALLSQGCKMVTDDVAAITLNDLNEPIVYPSYPSQKLWEDAIERMDEKVQGKSLNRISNDLNKYSVPNNEFFYRKPTTLKIIYEIIPDTVRDIIIEEVKGIERLNVVIKNTYRRFMTRGFDIKEWHFKQCTKIANEVLVYRIKRPEGMHLEKEIASSILEQIL
ncbi:hypothetical protein [Clostridium sp. AWRP]|uniref:hypothetical protein n=1 Tax=Clostridium sp. AWRP TaxID=2212991 RepID=UPI000FD76A13|nr:hypothetical protein [Clostridium sp. AWRP]AZV56474.1 hypothetical protein DMR38_07560 [Clostridium sp. AWRP]